MKFFNCKNSQLYFLTHTHTDTDTHTHTKKQKKTFCRCNLSFNYSNFPKKNPKIGCQQKYPPPFTTYVRTMVSTLPMLLMFGWSYRALSTDIRADVVADFLLTFWPITDIPLLRLCSYWRRVVSFYEGPSPCSQAHTGQDTCRIITSPAALLLSWFYWIRHGG